MRMSVRSKYRRSQLEPYFSRIRVPVHERPNIGVQELPAARQLDILRLLHKCHLCNIPFENLGLHYSWHRVIDVDPQVLYTKIIEQPGRGGHCLENNTLFNTLLVTLGFEAYMAGARMFDPKHGKYGGFEHCVNVVTIGEQQYLVDVGFGANAPLVPLRMDPARGGGEPQRYIGHTQVQLRHDLIPQGSSRRGKVWIYECRAGYDSDWTPLYCFADFEFLPEDIQILNLAPSVLHTSQLRQHLICTRFTTINDFKVAYGRLEVLTRWDNDDGDINGVLVMAGGALKLRTDGVTVYEVQFESEYERVKALGKYFGIKLSELDRHAIRGTATEIIGGKD